MPIFARFDSVCFECKKPTVKGKSRIVQHRGHWVHTACADADRVRSRNAAKDLSAAAPPVRLMREDVPDVLKGLVSAHASDIEAERKAIGAYLKQKRIESDPAARAYGIAKADHNRRRRAKRQRRNRGL